MPRRSASRGAPESFRHVSSAGADGVRRERGARGCVRTGRRGPVCGGGADEEVRFYYASLIGTEDDKAWFVELTVPARATVGTKLTIQVGDRVRHPIPLGMIEIVGKTLPFAEGRAEIAYEDFLSGLRNPRVTVRREGAVAAVQGRLLFF